MTSDIKVEVEQESWVYWQNESVWYEKCQPEVIQLCQSNFCYKNNSFTE